MASLLTGQWSIEALLVNPLNLPSQQIPGTQVVTMYYTRACSCTVPDLSQVMPHCAAHNCRSSKMDDVKENPWSEICWYMPESREQYRLSGKLYIIKSDEQDAELKKVTKQHTFCCSFCC